MALILCTHPSSVQHPCASATKRAGEHNHHKTSTNQPIAAAEHDALPHDAFGVFQAVHCIQPCSQACFTAMQRRCGTSQASCSSCGPSRAGEGGEVGIHITAVCVVVVVNFVVVDIVVECACNCWCCSSVPSPQGSSSSTTQQQPGPPPSEEELPIWVRREKERELQAGGKAELPWPLYLVASVLVAIASVSSFFWIEECVWIEGGRGMKWPVSPYQLLWCLGAECWCKQTGVAIAPLLLDLA